MSKLRFKVVESAFEKKVEDAPIPEKRVSEYYGSHVFNRAKMFKYLPEKYTKNWSIVSTIILL